MPKLVINPSDVVDFKTPLYDNNRDDDQVYRLLPETTADQVSLNDKRNVQVAIENIDANLTDARNTINIHIANKSNPHSVNKSQIGLSNIPNAVSSEINSQREDQLATSYAVKKAYDIAYAAKSLVDTLQNTFDDFTDIDASIIADIYIMRDRAEAAAVKSQNGAKAALELLRSVTLSENRVRELEKEAGIHADNAKSDSIAAKKAACISIYESSGNARYYAFKARVAADLARVASKESVSERVRATIEYDKIEKFVTTQQLKLEAQINEQKRKAEAYILNKQQEIEYFINYNLDVIRDHHKHICDVYSNIDYHALKMKMQMELSMVIEKHCISERIYISDLIGGYGGNGGGAISPGGTVINGATVAPVTIINEGDAMPDDAAIVVELSQTQE